MRIGDTVQLIFTEEIGVIVAYQDSEVFLVQLEDVEIPVFREHLKLVQPAKSKQVRSKPKNSRQEKERKRKEAAEKLKAMGFAPIPDTQPDRGVSIIFQPFYTADKSIDYFLLHLVNDTPKSLTIAYQCWVADQMAFSFKQTVHARKSLILNSLPYDQLNDRPKLQFDCQILNAGEAYQNGFNKILKPKAKLLRKGTRYFQIIDNDGFLVQLIPQLPKFIKVKTPPPITVTEEVIEQLKGRRFEQNLRNSSVGKKEKVVINAKQRVIDLHIEKLEPAYRGLRKGEMLQIQIKRFEKELEEAIERKERQMIVIHGIGKGKLKQEIIKRLPFYEEVVSFKNEYHPKYGFGATELFFEYE